MKAVICDFCKKCVIIRNSHKCMYCSHDIKNCGTGILYEQYDQMFINSDFENIIQECDSILEQNPDILVDAIMTLPSADQNIAEVEKIEMPNPKHEVYKCLNCGQYMHKTNWSHPVNYCSNCGAKLDW